MSAIEQMINNFGQTITVHRTTPGSFNEFGEWENGSDLPSSTMTASVQPAGGRDRELLPEGVKTEETKKLYSMDPLFTDSEDTKTKADELTIGSDRYKVIVCLPHGEGVLDHYKVFAQLVKAGS